MALGEAGARVYVTGRTTTRTRASHGRTETINETAKMITARGGEGRALRCDHTNDREVVSVFRRIEREAGRLDILVSNAWGGYEREITFNPFWEQPLDHWDLMYSAGVRAHLVACQLGAALMTKSKQRKGLIALTTGPVREKYIGNVIYDIAKWAPIRMAKGMAEDLRKKRIAVIALGCGWMRTEKVLENMKTDAEHWSEVDGMDESESPEYGGRAIAALATDPKVMDKTGQMFEPGALAREYGFKDIDGRQPPPFSERYPEIFG